MKMLSFGRDMAEAILADKKYLTTRKMTNRFKEGDKVQAMTPSRFGKVFAKLLVINVHKTIPSKDALWSHGGEGFQSPEAYLEKLKSINPDIDLDAEMTMIHFAVVKKFPEALSAD